MEKGVGDDGSPIRIWVSKFHGVLVIVHRSIDTTHHSLIVTKEENGQARHAIDGNKQLPFLEFMHHIGPWDDIHGDDEDKMISTLGAGHVRFFRPEAENPRCKGKRALLERAERIEEVAGGEQGSRCTRGRKTCLICGVSMGSIPVDLHILPWTGDSSPRGNVGEAARAKCDRRRPKRGSLIIGQDRHVDYQMASRTRPAMRGAKGPAADWFNGAPDLDRIDWHNRITRHHIHACPQSMPQWR